MLTQLKDMVKSIRNIEKSLGTGIKESSNSEQENIKLVRKSIVANRPIAKGEVLSEDNITTKRPGTGINPMLWHEIIGKKATQDYAEDDLI
jgi:N,N'-diacetyllegionaminate synthase